MTDHWHKQEYEKVRAQNPHYPPWDDLPEEHKEEIRHINRNFWDMLEKIAGVLGIEPEEVDEAMKKRRH